MSLKTTKSLESSKEEKNSFESFSELLLSILLFYIIIIKLFLVFSEKATHTVPYILPVTTAEHMRVKKCYNFHKNTLRVVFSGQLSYFTCRIFSNLSVVNTLTWHQSAGRVSYRPPCRSTGSYRHDPLWLGSEGGIVQLQSCSQTHRGGWPKKILIGLKIKISKWPKISSWPKKISISWFYNFAPKVFTLNFICCWSLLRK